jgi:hypothetical protein
MSQSKIINNTRSGNYVSENSIFILDIFSADTSNELIGNLADMVADLPIMPTKYKTDRKRTKETSVK